MTTLLLRFAGPLQSWGASSRFTVRATRREPTKSGVLGLIAAAQGRRRSDPIEDLLQLKVGVRVDQPGTLLRDFQTARNDKGKSMPLSNRYYLTDAVFVVGIEGEAGLIEGIKNALKRPRYPLYLGRRSCPPAFPLVLKTVDKPLNKALLPESVDWQAAPWFTKRVARKGYVADLISDSSDFGDGNEHKLEETVRDVPISFDMRNRQYSWRTVYRSSVTLCDPPQKVAHDPLFELEDA